MITNEFTPPPLAAAIREQLPGIAAVCRVFHWSDFTMRPDDDLEKAFRETNVYAVDENFFEVLDYGLLAGDPAAALKAPASVVLPESAAIRYFGEQAVRSGQVVGRHILGGKDAGTPWTVTGMMADQPANSHLRFDFLVSASSYPDDLYRNQDWGWNIMHTYLRVREGASIEELQAGLGRIAQKQALPAMGYDPVVFQKEGNRLGYLLQPLTDIHLASHYRREMHPNGSLLYVRIFGLAGLFILLIACVNYINLYTARSFQRAKEVGVRKVMGATVANILQLLSRDFLKLVALAFLVATPLTWWAMNRWLQGFAYRVELHWWVFALAGAIAAAITLLTVGIQALKAALADPAEALRCE